MILYLSFWSCRVGEVDALESDVACESGGLEARLRQTVDLRRLVKKGDNGEGQHVRPAYILSV